MTIKRFLFVALIASIFLMPLISKADEGWVIDSFDSYIVIQKDGKVNVEEKIGVDFGNLEKHGIYRDIPYIYRTQDNKKTYTKVEVVNVTSGVSRIPYKVEKNQSNLRIRIGDPNQTVSGKQNYKINYLVSGVLNSYYNYDELYWNVTGLDWPVPIKESAATVVLPEPGVIQSSCYRGSFGSRQTCDAEKISDKIVRFNFLDVLSPGEGLAVALGYAKGMVPILKIAPPETFFDKVFSLNTLISFSAIFAVGLYFIIRAWWRHGRDLWWGRKSSFGQTRIEADASTRINADGQQMPFGADETIVPEYEPPLGLRPAEIGTLIDEKADTLDVSATIVDLAVRGYLIITETEKKWIFGKIDYLLTRTDKSDKELMLYEQLLLVSLFRYRTEIKLSELKNKFYNDLRKVKKALYQEVARKNLFTKNPETTRSHYIKYAALAIAAGIAFIFISSKILNSALIGAGLGVITAGVVLIFVGYIGMPQRTALGRETYRQARGYKLFVSGTEKYRQPFFENRSIFMDVLPYAIVFGVTKKLASAFAEMGIEPPQPSWYRGVGAFNIAVFSASIDSFSSSLSSAMMSSPSGSGSGGGGFSGGGFGGGGGGSW